MKEMQDNHWIDKIRDMLENYTPADPPGDWKQFQRELKRALPWPARWLPWIRKPWVYGVILGAALITGAICLYPDAAPEIEKGLQVSGIGGREEEERIKMQDQRKSKEEKERKDYREESADVLIPAPVTGPEEISNPGLQAGAPTPPSSAPVIPAIAASAPPYHPENTQVQPATGNRQPVTDILQPETGNRQPATDSLQPATGNRQPATKKRLDLRSIRLPGDPWKVGLGYEYLPLIQPDTGKGSFRGFNIRFSKEVSERLWLGTGLTIGRIDLIDVSKNWVRDWSKTDSLGTIYLRDSTTSEHRWQNHIAMPLTITWDLYRNNKFAVPFEIGTTLGVVHNQRYRNIYDGTGGSAGGSPSSFTYFITADLSLGYEVYYLKGLSATLSATYQRVLTGSRSFGFRENFFGARILVNLDFNATKW